MLLIQYNYSVGLKYIHAMTFYSRSELRIDLMKTRPGRISEAYSVFPDFWLSAAPNYTLHVNKGHGSISKYKSSFDLYNFLYMATILY